MYCAFRYVNYIKKVMKMNIKNRTAAVIASECIEAKREETQANKKRVGIEDELVALLGAKDEGSETHNIDDFKIAITGRLNRKVDWDVFDKLAIPIDMQPVKVKRELDLKGLRYLEDNEPSTYKKLAKAMTVEPAKTSVTVTRKEF